MAGPVNKFGGPVTTQGSTGDNVATPAASGDLEVGDSQYQLADTTAGDVTLDIQAAADEDGAQVWYFQNAAGANNLVVRDDSGGAPAGIITLTAGQCAMVTPGGTTYAVWGPFAP